MNLKLEFFGKDNFHLIGTFEAPAEGLQQRINQSIRNRWIFYIKDTDGISYYIGPRMLDDMVIKIHSENTNA